MRLRVEWRGLDKLATNAKRLVKRMEQAAGRGALAGADRIADGARDRVPVRTGRLKSAIYARAEDGTKPAAVAGVDSSRAPYSHFVEFGSSRAAAQPFMRPAVRAGRVDALKAIAEQCGEALD